jgi:hypothetical protein
LSMAYGPEFAFRRTDREFCSFFGNAILCSTPLQSVSVVPVPVLYDWSETFMRKGVGSLVRIGARSGLVAKTKIAGHDLMIGVLHTESRTGPSGRESQMAGMMKAFPSRGAAIIGGDFNATTIGSTGPLALAGLAIKFAIDPMRLRDPERHEPLFQRVREHGFETSGANAALRPTFTPTRFLPRFIRPKLDWICYREILSAASSIWSEPATA